MDERELLGNEIRNSNIEVFTLLKVISPEAENFTFSRWIEIHRTRSYTKPT